MHRRQFSRIGIERAQHAQHFRHADALHLDHRAQGGVDQLVNIRRHIGAAAMAHLHQPCRCQAPDRLPDGCAADAIALGQLFLGRQFGATGKLPVQDLRTQALQDLLGRIAAVQRFGWEPGRR